MGWAEVGINSISAGIGDLPCFPTFYFYDPLSNLKFLIFPYACHNVSTYTYCICYVVLFGILCYLHVC